MAERSKVTIPILHEKKSAGEKITMVTAYDYPTARLLDEAGVDILLVGDSVGPVVLGYPNTLPVTMEEMIHHSKAVVRGREYAHVVFDMPFMSYHEGPKHAIRNAGRAIKETGCDAVKLEGGQNVAEITAATGTAPMCPTQIALVMENRVWRSIDTVAGQARRMIAR